jgi:radical SAM superfamily enzyme YgiQ (UPF0313 family)
MGIKTYLNHNRSPAVFVTCPHKYIIDDQTVTVGQDKDKEMPPLAPLLLLGKLRQHKLPCDFLDWSSYSNHLIDEIATIASRYSIVFVSSNSINWSMVNLLAGKIKKNNYKCKICIGGPHPSLYPMSVSKTGNFDLIISGEADHDIVSIYTRLTEKISSSDAPVLLSCPDIDLIENDNSIAYDLIPPNLYESIPVETSRGCKYNCSFCSILSHRNWRGYSAVNANNELKIASNFMLKKGCNTIQIVDNSFTSNNKRAIAICSNLPEDVFENTLSYDTTIADLQNQELLSVISNLTKHVLVGAEAHTETLAKQINKPTTPDLIKKAAKNLYNFNTSRKSVFSFIIGFPWQTKGDCIKTIDFATDLILTYGINAMIQWYWPIPGSMIWSDLEKKKTVNIDMIDSPTTQGAVELFFKSNPLNVKDIIAIEDKINPINLCLMLKNESFGKPKLKITNSPLKLQSLTTA